MDFVAIGDIRVSQNTHFLYKNPFKSILHMF